MEMICIYLKLFVNYINSFHYKLDSIKFLRHINIIIRVILRQKNFSLILVFKSTKLITKLNKKYNKN